ncbi:hypothetical protein [Methanosarcina mazei]|uniref:Uncharacterized protein n=1 Tax=Methanosarcina mazei TaxID=2209 RepID=A0A0F8HB89_METMZ|nr:hypothetical protein [Methanosarcina mazei]KKG64149.1 hypothetical protein DU67_12100 [Methanosarcina mazei]
MKSLATVYKRIKISMKEDCRDTVTTIGIKHFSRFSENLNYLILSFLGRTNCLCTAETIELNILQVVQLP